jgi:hypothetical protein
MEDMGFSVDELRVELKPKKVKKVLKSVSAG